MPIAIKFGLDHKAFTREYDAYIAMKSMNVNEKVEEIGIPTVQIFSVACKTYYAMAISLCGETIGKFVDNKGPLSPVNLLCVFYWAVSAESSIVICSCFNFEFNFKTK